MSEHGVSPTDREWEAIKSQVDSLRAEQLERIRTQHQLVVVSGALAGAVAAVALRAPATEPWTPALLLGLSLIFWLLGYSMLNQERAIAHIGHYLSTSSELSVATATWAAWERDLNKNRKDWLPGVPVAGLFIVAHFSIPFGAGIATAVGYAVLAPWPWALAVALPGLLVVHFLWASRQVRAAFDEIGAPSHRPPDS